MRLLRMAVGRKGEQTEGERMKDKTLKRRREKSAEQHEQGTSKYAQKNKQHRKGYYNQASPFRAEPKEKRQ